MSSKQIQWGIAPIGWRNDDLPEIGQENTLGHVLGDMHIAGFEGTEVGGFFPEAATLKREADLRGLKIIGRWFSSFLIRDGLESVSEEFHEHCRYLQETEADIAVVSEQTYSIQKLGADVFSEKPVFSDKEWEILCHGLNELGTIAGQYDLKLAYHHHLGTGIQTLEDIGRLMEGTDPGKVHLLYDTGHIYVSDQDCLTLLKQHINRVAHIHFKDVRDHVMLRCREKNMSFLNSFLEGLFTVPGDGQIDFKAVYEEVLKHDYRGWIVIEAEQDPVKAHPLEYALKARRYIDTVLSNRTN